MGASNNTTTVLDLAVGEIGKAFAQTVMKSHRAHPLQQNHFAGMTYNEIMLAVRGVWHRDCLAALVTWMEAEGIISRLWAGGRAINKQSVQISRFYWVAPFPGCVPDGPAWCQKIKDIKTFKTYASAKIKQRAGNPELSGAAIHEMLGIAPKVRREGTDFVRKPKVGRLVKWAQRPAPNRW